MNLNNERVQFRDSGARLRRARRLYGYLLYRHYIHERHYGNNGRKIPNRSLYYRAYKAKKAGLYSEKTTIRNVAWSLVRHIKKHSFDGRNWYAWMERYIDYEALTCRRTGDRYWNQQFKRRKRVKVV